MESKNYSVIVREYDTYISSDLVRDLVKENNMPKICDITFRDCEGNTLTENFILVRIPQDVSQEDYKTHFQPEFLDFTQVQVFGAKKHPDSTGKLNWLQPNGVKSSFTQMHDSAFHHIAQSFAGGPEKMAIDEESGLPHLLMGICRLQMVYTRMKRKLKHDED